MHRSASYTLGAAAAAALLLAGPAQAGTQVNFIAPQTYADGNLGWSAVDQRLTLEGIERIVGTLAARTLPKGYDLSIEVLGLDLAGRIDPLASRTGTLRVMRADTWPTMRVRYTLRAGSRVVARGEDTLTSLDYLADPVAVRSLDALRFEKAMLARWFDARFRAYPPQS